MADTHYCRSILTYGMREGEKCGVRAKYPVDNPTFCGKHYRGNVNPTVCAAPQQVVKKETIQRIGTVEQLLAENPSRSVWSVIIEQNTYDKILFQKVMNRQIAKKEFKTLASERFLGQWNWSMDSFNIRAPAYLCKHACFYCYIGVMFRRFGRVCKTPSIEEPMPVNQKSIDTVWSKAANSKRKMMFFPSSSDIFAENMRDYVSVCRKIIDAGHEILFITKASMASITAFVREFEQQMQPIDNYKPKIVIFITVTTNVDAILRKFEPYAPLYQERIGAIIHLIEHRFNVNVIIEPYLSDPIAIIQEVEPILHNHGGIITVGQMNYTAAMMLNRDPAKDKELKDYLAELYSPANIIRLWKFAEDKPNIFLKKDSVGALLKTISPQNEAPQA
ncbi:MAG: hypothetical protein M0R33_22330 [Methylomonas sp.]|jgi:DNA repair photolyase|uniref:hypothetical protein n=1 Tax=Methylomonas sp. TaxID=418 RepID=UPI0025EB2546|nr:hypothetical protein [Methylomonas sp.]MCK9609182.1 hypothetical protein [Methylomonas sp.]